MAIDGLGEEEVDLSFDGVTCEVERFVELYEGWGHCWVIFNSIKMKRNK